MDEVKITIILIPVVAILIIALWAFYSQFRDQEPWD